MKTAGNQKAESLFGEALELPSGEREAFVLSATSERNVQERVLRMLEEERRLGDYMETRAIPLEVEAGSPAARHVFSDRQLVAQRYRIERLINAGGMGEVYEAYDLQLKRQVALKTILPSVAGNAQAMSRFRNEVALATEVTHPNVCRVFDLGEHTNEDGNGSVAFLTMQLLPGDTLAERLKRRGTLDANEALPLIRQMAEALGAAHRVGVVHRDFKPGNVMLVPDGESGERAIVTDFGLARTIAGEDRNSALTQTGQVLGTPNYMAPEQWMGKPVSAATDIYALGVVIHEMLTGSRPGAEDVEQSAALDGRCRRIIDRCLENDPQSRPASTAEVLAGLHGEAPTPPSAPPL